MSMYTGASACPFPGQLRYRVVRDGAGVFFEKNFQTMSNAPLRVGTVICGTPRNDPSGMSAFVVEVGNGYMKALDLEQLDSAMPAQVLATGEFVGESSSTCPPGMAPVLHGGQWQCIPTLSGQVPQASDEHVGGWDLFHDVFGWKDPFHGSHQENRWEHHHQEDQRRQNFGQDFGRGQDFGQGQHPHDRAWEEHHRQEEERRRHLEHPHHDAHEHEFVGDGQTIVPVLPCPHGQFFDAAQNHCVPNIPPPPPAFPDTLDQWRKQQPLSSAVTSGYCAGQSGPAIVGYVGACGAAREFVGAAAADGDPAATAAVHAENAAVQAKSAQAAATHPAANGKAKQSADAATVHAAHAVKHAKAASAASTVVGALAHSEQAAVHGQAAAAHAADAHSAIGNASIVGYYVGAAAAATQSHPAAAAVVHAQNAVTQAHSANEAAAHPASNGRAQQAARLSQTHAAQALTHARAAASHPSPQASAVHAQHAMRHAHEAASHAVNAHDAIRRPGERLGDRGRFGGGRRDAYGRFQGRRLFGEWRGVGHPGWRRGVGARWLRYRASCHRHGGWACFIEEIYEPGGNVCYRVTPAGMMENIQLAPEEQAANVQYAQTTGQAVPTANDGPMPGSDPAASGSQAPADSDQDSGDDSSASSDDSSSTDDSASDGAAADVAASDPDADSDASDDTATSGDFAGWQDPFTSPYPGFMDPYSPEAWDSSFVYPGVWPGYYGY